MGTIFREVSARQCTVTARVVPSLGINSHIKRPERDLGLRCRSPQLYFYSPPLQTIRTNHILLSARTPLEYHSPFVINRCRL